MKAIKQSYELLDDINGEEILKRIEKNRKGLLQVGR